MSDPTDDLFEFLDEDWITVPGVKSKAHPEGKAYRFASPDIETGARLHALQDIALRIQRKEKVSETEANRLVIPDGKETDFHRTIMGETYDELKADGVSWLRFQKLSQYLYVAFVNGEEAAKKAASEGAFSGKGQVRPLNRQARRKKK